jgi:hypothetical protein
VIDRCLARRNRLTPTGDVVIDDQRSASIGVRRPLPIWTGAEDARQRAHRDT